MSKLAAMVSVVVVLWAQTLPARAQKCGIDATGEINIIASVTPATVHIARALAACASDKLGLNVRLTDRLADEVALALPLKPAPYGLAEVTSHEFAGLLAAGQLAPLTELVKKYKDKFGLDERMLIGAGNDVFAIAFLADTQVLLYRRDILRNAGIKPPTTLDDLLAVSQKLQARGFPTPLGGSYRSGMELAGAFSAVYLSLNGEFFEKATPKAAFVNEKAEQTIDILRRLLAFAPPESASLSQAEVAMALDQGRIVMATLGLASVGDLLGDTDRIGFLPMPSLAPGGPPISALTWHGFVSPKTFDGNKDAAFLAMMQALSHDSVTSGQTQAPWLRASPGTTAFDAVLDANVLKLPQEPYFALAEGALARHLSGAVFAGKPAQEALTLAAQAYEIAAREKGFLKP